MQFTFTARNKPECNSFLEIKAPNGEYQPIDESIKAHPTISEAALERCCIMHRGLGKTYKQDVDDYVAFSEAMMSVKFDPSMLIAAQSIKPALYFAPKSIECLQFSHFCTMKSNLILDTDYNIHWSQGYVATQVEGEKIGAPCQEPEAKYEMKDFKSPIEIDIDDKVQEFANTHTAICDCIGNVIVDIDFEQYAIQMGGNHQWINYAWNRRI